MAFSLGIVQPGCAEERRFDGEVRDVGVGADGTLWAIAAAPTPGDGPPGKAALWRRGSDGAWSIADDGGLAGGAERIAVDPFGMAWIVGRGQSIWRHDGERFQKLKDDAKAHDIGIGTDWQVWAIGANQLRGGFDIRRSHDSGQNWTTVKGAATDVAVDAAGHAWVVNDRSGLYRWDGEDWVPLLDRRARDVAVAGDGAVWIVGNEPVPGGFKVWRSVDGGGTWADAGVAGLRIGAGPEGAAWVANDSRTVFRVDPPASLQPGMLWESGPVEITTIPAKPHGPEHCIGVDGHLQSAGGAPGDPTRGSLVSCPDPASGPPIVVTGLPSEFRPQGVFAGTYLCPIIGTGGKLNKGCQDPFDQSLQAKTNGRATYRAAAKNDSCRHVGRAAGFAPAFFDPRNGGQCWSCPVLMRRTMRPVYDDLACSAGNDDGIMWQPAQYPEPGLLEFVAHGDILRLAFADPAHVEAFVQRRAGGDAKKAQDIWRDMADRPNDSSELKALVFAQILAMAKADPHLSTNAGQQSVAMFESYIQKRREYLAEEALQMYDRFLDLNAYRQWKGLGEVLRAGGPLSFGSSGTGAVIVAPSASIAGTLGSAPDDYVNAAYAGAIPDDRGKAFIAALVDLADTPPAAGPAAGPDSIAVLGDVVLGWTAAAKAANSAKGVHDLLETLQVIGQVRALTGRPGIGIDLGMGLMGQVLDAVAGVLTFVAQREAEVQYAKLSEEARKPVQLEAMITGGTQDDKNALMAWWALATSAHRGAQNAGMGSLANDAVCAAKESYECERIGAIVRTAEAKARPKAAPRRSDDPRRSRSGAECAAARGCR